VSNDLNISLLQAVQRIVFAGCDFCSEDFSIWKSQRSLCPFGSDSLGSSYGRSSAKYVLDMYTTLQTAQRIVNSWLWICSTGIWI